MQDMLRFITCGSVDDGKSTLIGRLLYDNKMIFKDQLDVVEKDSKKYGTTGEKMDLALLVDGLQSEKEQGITIDVAYRYFFSKNKKFIIADTPGHEQYTRNMATGASNADLALILIDAKKGVLTQTKRHSYIVSLLGIKNIIVVVNKMDLVDYSYDVFENIKKEYIKIIPKLEISQDIKFEYIPICAINGDNIINKSDKMPWYRGKTLMKLLENTEVADTNQKDDFRFPVQYINRPNQNFRGYMGTIASGSIEVGDQVIVFPSEKTSKIKSIILPAVDELRQINIANFPMAITITLEDELDISRGDIIVQAISKPKISDKFEAIIIWVNEKPMQLNESYLIKRATTSMGASFICIEYKKDIDTFKKQFSDKLELNDIAKCTVKLDRKMAFDAYSQNRYTGSFIIIDKYTNDTLGAGMIMPDIQEKESKIRNNKQYSSAEKDLNAFITKHYPDWNCSKII